MAAMKPRTGDGPLEVTKEGRGIVMRVPLEGGGRLVVEMTPDEAETLSQELKNLNGLPESPIETHPSCGPGGGRGVVRGRDLSTVRTRAVPTSIEAGGTRR
ncbi:hypothetical protein Snas_0704 [Stackebrandtia nassauensis DSM 44728]|uniref:DUF3117 domain-containing protein n=1 Tax=Stackebrandtia nassauensis (strain DSM 44728 / CIP 108903 / NRRL B-16338 / NBRC 102104 / LLR-40K-21) TaxID=446470 RepID=D3Q718_STANL|nr:hypothetical protein Snas_0704 [Stackebrandtia nassauensis DSM 44728]